MFPRTLLALIELNRMFTAIKAIFMGLWLQNQTNGDRVKGLKVNMIKCT
jgi:hypothetical protein